MGFKSRAKKKQELASAAKGPSKKEKEEYSGEIRCDVAGCKNWADKKIGGRKLGVGEVVHETLVTCSEIISQSS